MDGGVYNDDTKYSMAFDNVSSMGARKYDGFPMRHMELTQRISSQGPRMG